MIRDKWKGSPYVVAILALLIAIPLFRELGSESPIGLKVLMAAILTGLVLGAFLLSRFLAQNMDDVGEARFDSTENDDR
ncbi:hypothetical protein GRI62_00640 [Erythrobacter arachoides]|uniref:Uncharacterized protein n=1 Tax=Aurantiacibacter arachoides TaxID=1850444 RepID=A0A844ZXZ2_9SPHN|nr:hypothetical protein [Aurantiacibacter arachoides]MXO92112.1 hypothetical protein [Aurantiacibacter arachoides]